MCGEGRWSLTWGALGLLVIVRDAGGCFQANCQGEELSGVYVQIKALCDKF